MPKLYSAFETLCCLCTKKYRNYKITSKQDNEKMPQIMPSAPPPEPALPGPPSVSDQLIEKPSAPPMDQSGAMGLSEDYKDHRNFDTRPKLTHKELQELNNSRENWRLNNPNITHIESNYPRFMQKKHYNLENTTKKQFQPTQYIAHTKSTDDSYEEII